MDRRTFISLSIAFGGVSLIPKSLLMAGQQYSGEEYKHQHPEFAVDGGHTLWMASLLRSDSERKIRVDKINNGKAIEKVILAPEGLTGISKPAIAGMDSGCIVAFPVEQDDSWHVAYTYINENSSSSSTYKYVQTGGTANVFPFLATNNGKAEMVWESNADGNRGIYHCTLDEMGHGQISKISVEGVNSYNPCIVAMKNGNMFAAWDSYKDYRKDIYGAWFRNGKWESPRRLTSDARLESHPHLALRGDELWMTWQAQTYLNRKSTKMVEKRIVVARISEKNLKAPLGLFTEVSIDNNPDKRTSEGKRILDRPRIAFDSGGRLWLSAALGMDKNQSGWNSVAFCYNGDAWSDMMYLSGEQGRWHETPLYFPASNEPVAAVQSDDLPQGWDETRGSYSESAGWHSEINVRKLSLEIPPTASEFKTEPLQMPPTDFNLKRNILSHQLELPQQTWKHGEKLMNLYWGDLHNHTDISVCDRRGDQPGHDLYATARDIDKLDFCAITDHGYNFDIPQWQLNGEQTRYNHDPGKFVTLLAEEWTSDANPNKKVPKEERGYGHRNIIFLNPYQEKYYDAYDGDIAPSEVWKDLKKNKIKAIVIPHQLADMGTNVPVDWSFYDEEYQPLAEIYQGRGSYEYLGCPRQAGSGANFTGNYYQDALARGHIVGVVASPDHGGGTGKVGVWARELSRKSIFEALQARHTFGTSGSKMALQFSTGNAIMGDKTVLKKGPIKFTVKAVSAVPISEVVIFRDNEIVHRQTPDLKEFTLTWTDKDVPSGDKHWYYARIQAANNELAWSSPIWFIKA